MKNFGIVSLLLVFMISSSGCSTIAKKWKSLIGSGDSETSANTTPDGKPITPSFNNDPTYGTFKERQYKRMTKQNFSDEQALEENAGSLWKKEGQGSFLFSQNNLRVIGDIINVEVEGKTAENLNIKVAVLKKSQVKTDPAAVAKPVPKAVASIPRPASQVERAPAATPPANNGDEAQASAQPGQESKKEGMKFDTVPCRIVDKNADGSYRVKGLQIVYIGKKEYKLIVTGNIRADDVSQDTISSSKVIESKFDLVATNKDI